MTLIFFIIMLIGNLNWLSIGLLQYDFIAGLFGSQASMFSRLFYILIGISCFYILFDVFRNHGKLLLLSRHRTKNKKLKENNEENNSNIIIE